MLPQTVIDRQVSRHPGVSLLGVLERHGVVPFLAKGLNEPFGFAVGPWRAGPSDAQPSQQGWSPRESRRSTQRSRLRHRPTVGASPAPSCWPRGLCHGEAHHPHSPLFSSFGFLP